MVIKREVPVYDQNVIYILGEPKDSADFVRMLNAPELKEIEQGIRSGTVDGFCWHDGHGDFYVYLENPRDAAVLAHECFHLVFKIARLVGLEFSMKSEEAFAYLLSHFVGELTSIAHRHFTPSGRLR